MANEEIRNQYEDFSIYQTLEVTPIENEVPNDIINVEKMRKKIKELFKK